MPGIVIGWLIIAAIIGVVLLGFRADKLEVVIRTMQKGVRKSLGSGIIGQLAMLPGAIAVCALLAATLIGILLIPLGLIAFMVAVAGIAMFGFVAVATMTGEAIIGASYRDETPHGALLRAFFTGTALFMGMWLLVAVLYRVPLIGPMLESFASAVTFIAVTTGSGAVLLSWWRGEFKGAKS